MSESEHIEADLQTYGALGLLELDGNVVGAVDHVADTLRGRLELLGPGDTMLVRVHRPVPADHPLSGIARPEVGRPAVEVDIRTTTPREPDDPDLDPNGPNFAGLSDGDTRTWAAIQHLGIPHRYRVSAELADRLVRVLKVATVQ